MVPPNTSVPLAAGPDLDSLVGRATRRLLAAGDLQRPAPARAQLLAEAVAESLPGAECVVGQPFGAPRWEMEVLGAAGGRGPGLVGRRLPVEHGPVARSLDEGRPIELTGVNRAKGLFGPHDRVSGACRVEPALGAGRQVIGLLIVLRPATHAFTDPERQTIEELAHLVPLVLRDLWLGEPAPSGSAAVVLAELARGTGALPAGLVERARSHVAAASASLWRVRGGKAELLEAQPQGMPVRRGHQVDLARLPLVERAARTARPVVAAVRDAADVDGLAAAGLTAPRSAAVVPLPLHGDVAGVLLFGDSAPVRFWREQVEAAQLLGATALLAAEGSELATALGAAHRVQSRLLNGAAHELRTPLTAIAASLSLLTDGAYGEPSPDWHRPVDVAAAKAAELGELLEDLLVAARLESGDLRPYPVRVELQRVVRDALHRAEPRIRLLRADVSVRLPDEPAFAHADPLHTSRIVDVLLTNALGSAERPRVRVTVLRRGARILVEDRGPTISPHQREHVFDPVLEHDDAEAGLRPAAGLGLYLARELAVGQGGTLSLVASRAARGSAFLLALPAA